jgi:hypothetical protein
VQGEAPEIVFDERSTGYPNPSAYDQYFINSYSLPKGLHCYQREQVNKPPKKSLYDFKQPK